MQVEPADTYLEDELDGTVYLPQPQTGSFDLSSSGRYATFLVIGSEQALASSSSNLPSTPPSSRSVTVSSSPSPYHAPMFRSVIAPKRGVLNKFTLKIVKANMIRNAKGKVEFDITMASQTHIELTEETANLRYILETVHKRWGEEYKLVTNDGVELEDSPGIQGATFNSVN